LRHSKLKYKKAHKVRKGHAPRTQRKVNSLKKYINDKLTLK